MFSIIIITSLNPMTCENTRQRADKCTGSMYAYYTDTAEKQLGCHISRWSCHVEVRLARMEPGLQTTRVRPPQGKLHLPGRLTRRCVPLARRHCDTRTRALGMQKHSARLYTSDKWERALRSRYSKTSDRPSRWPAQRLQGTPCRSLRGRCPLRACARPAGPLIKSIQSDTHWTAK